LPFNIALTPEADSSASLVILTADFVSFRRQPAASRAKPQIKCVVWDLDNTLWDGVLIEDAEVKPKPEVVGLIRRFDERGILSSVASKNDHELAWERLERAGLGEYFLAPQINWLPKSQNIRHIAERLNIGLDTFAFVDDNPFELAEVARALPQVTTINAAEIAGTLDDPRFQGSASEDARQRRRYYQDAFRREERREAFGEDYLGFLADCEIRLEVRHYRPGDFERAAELAQRTNQLNFSGTKYSRQELAGLLEQDRFEKYLLDCSDRYGSYGVVGFSLVERQTDEIRVEDLMLSCRAQGRFIEQAFFHYLQERHSPGLATRLWVNFRATPRNKPAQQVLEALHFTPCAAGDGLWLDLSKHSLAGHVISVRDAQIQGDSG
jgi:FkbH-like protein